MEIAGVTFVEPAATERRRAYLNVNDELKESQLDIWTRMAMPI